MGRDVRTIAWITPRVSSSLPRFNHRTLAYATAPTNARFAQGMSLSARGAFVVVVCCVRCLDKARLGANFRFPSRSPRSVYHVKLSLVLSDALGMSCRGVDGRRRCARAAMSPVGWHFISEPVVRSALKKKKNVPCQRERCASRQVRVGRCGTVWLRHV